MAWASPHRLVRRAVNGERVSGRWGETGAMAHHSRLDKIVIDVAPADHDAEVAFWSGVTGQPMTQGRRHPEYHWAEIPGRTSASSSSGSTRVPAACTSTSTPPMSPPRPPAWSSWRARIREVNGWWIMQDPAGLPFCVISGGSERLTDDNAQTMGVIRPTDGSRQAAPSTPGPKPGAGRAPRSPRYALTARPSVEPPRRELGRQ